MNSLPHGENKLAVAPEIMGTQGAVVTNHWAASSVGRDILKSGGNAVDASVAISFALGVVEPQSSGLGGDGFMMIYDNEKKRVKVANGTGAAPSLATVDFYKSGIPLKGILSASIPGLVDAVLAAHEKYGSLSLEKCLEPAISFCKGGFPISAVQSEALKLEKEMLSFETSRKIWAPKGTPADFGEIIYNPDLAETIKGIIKYGRDYFYEGKVAKEICDFSKKQGGIFEINDFKDHRMFWQDPIFTNYRDHWVYEAPPNSTGITLLQQLNILENFNQENFDPVSLNAIHLMVEAKKLCFADRENYVADPDFFDVPVSELLSKNYARERASLINLTKVIPEEEIYPGDFLYKNSSQKISETTYFGVIDKSGNAVSALQSIQTNWGSGLVAGDTGILLNNRMTYWHLQPNHPDLLTPKKRVRHTMNPVMIFSEKNKSNHPDNLKLICGTPGADTQVQTNMQVISAFLDSNYQISEAVCLPRWTHLQNLTLSTIPHTTHNALQVENRIDNDVLNKLKNLGHKIDLLEPWGGSGSEGMISINQETGVFSAAVDPRRDGQAIAW